MPAFFDFHLKTKKVSLSSENHHSNMKTAQFWNTAWFYRASAVTQNEAEAAIRTRSTKFT